MKKKTYKWLYRLIDKITKKDCSNNNHFMFYGYDVDLTSGTRDYVSCFVSNLTNQRVITIDFSFDYWTKELIFNSYIDYEARNAVFNAFKEIYGHVTVFDEVIDDEIRFYNKAETREYLGDDYCNIQIEKLEDEKIKC